MELHEILIASRGGQGGVISGKLVTLAAFYDNKSSMTIPKYGAERRGAPISVGVRISDQPIKKHTPVVGPSFVIAFDPTVVPKLMDVSTLLNTSLILNTTEVPDWAQSLPSENIYLVDANAIAREAGLVRSGIVMVSTVMPAAFAKISGLIKLEHLKEAVYHSFGKSKIAEMNISAIEKAYEAS